MNNQKIGSSLVACLCAAFIGSGCGDAGAGPTSEPFPGVGEAATSDQEASSDGNLPATSDGEALFAGGQVRPDSSNEAGVKALAQCSEICRHLVAAGCIELDCAAECPTAVTDPCFDEFVAFYDCAFRHPGFSCVDGNFRAGDVSGCLAEAEAVNQCQEAHDNTEPAPPDERMPSSD